jgi:hypothetical protein
LQNPKRRPHTKATQQRCPPPNDRPSTTPTHTHRPSKKYQINTGNFEKWLGRKWDNFLFLIFGQDLRFTYVEIYKISPPIYQAKAFYALAYRVLKMVNVIMLKHKFSPKTAQDVTENLLLLLSISLKDFFFFFLNFL